MRVNAGLRRGLEIYAATLEQQRKMKMIENEEKKAPGFLLKAGVFFMPWVLGWFVLARGRYTNSAKGWTAAWMTLVMCWGIAAFGADSHPTASGGSHAARVAPGALPSAVEAPEAVVFTEEVTPCVALGNAFSTKSKKSELQLDKIFESMKGKLFEYDLRVGGVEVTFGTPSVHAKCSGRAATGIKAVFQGADYLLDAGDTPHDELLAVNIGDVVKICGRFKSYTRFTGIHAELVSLSGCARGE